MGQKGGFQSKQELTAMGKEMGMAKAMGKGRTQIWLQSIILEMMISRTEKGRSREPGLMGQCIQFRNVELEE